MRFLLVTFLGLVLPFSGASAGGRIVCNVVHQRAVVVESPAVLVEIAVPVAAVSFAYLAPPAIYTTSASSHVSSNVPEISHQHAAKPFDSQSAASYRAEPTSGIASLLQQRCGQCHQQQTKGGVRLLDAAGHLSLARNGQPLSKLDVARVVYQGRMPPTGAIAESEKATILDWVLRSNTLSSALGE
jgi:cytochrome c5